MTFNAALYATLLAIANSLGIPVSDVKVNNVVIATPNADPNAACWQCSSYKEPNNGYLITCACDPAKLQK